MWFLLPEYLNYRKIFDCDVSYQCGAPAYSDITGSYSLKDVTEEEIVEIIKKSAKDGVNHLFEKCKNNKIIKEFKPDCWYDY